MSKVRLGEKAKAGGRYTQIRESFGGYTLRLFDIRYRAPRRNERGEIVEEGQVTALLNGVKVQDNTGLGEPRSRRHPYRYGTTPYLQQVWERQKKTMTGPVFLQDLDAAVHFRNIWIHPLDDRAPK